MTDLVASIEFGSSFNECYARNNRSTGQKSLRCFPGCNEIKHVTSGFCGQILRCFITFKDLAQINWQDILFIAFIHPTSEKNLYSVLMDKSLMLERLRDSNTQTGDFVLGKISSIYETRVEVLFNTQLHSWDYGWKSNRWSGVLETHVVEIMVMVKHSQEYFLVISNAFSPPFFINSSKKQRKPATKTHSTIKKPSRQTKTLRNHESCQVDNDFISESTQTLLLMKKTTNNQLTATILPATPLIQPSCYLYDIKRRRDMCEEGARISSSVRDSGPTAMELAGRSMQAILVMPASNRPMIG